MSDLKVSDVKTCPFCGKAPSVEVDDVVTVACINGDCHMSMCDEVEISKWNERHHEL